MASSSKYSVMIVGLLVLLSALALVSARPTDDGWYPTQSGVVLVASVLILFFFLQLLKDGSGSKTQKARLPPGPWKLPIIGSMHHLVGSLTHHALRDLAKTYGPLMYLKLGEVPLVVVSSAEVAKETLTSHDLNFSSRPSTIATKTVFDGGIDMIFTPYGEFWRQIRKLFVLELLSAKRVQSFQSVREEAALDLVNNIRTMGPTTPVNVSKTLHSFTNNLGPVWHRF